MWGPGLSYGLLLTCERIPKHEGEHRTYDSTGDTAVTKWHGRPTAEEIAAGKRFLAEAEAVRA